MPRTAPVLDTTAVQSRPRHITRPPSSTKLPGVVSFYSCDHNISRLKLEIFMSDGYLLLLDCQISHFEGLE